MAEGDDAELALTVGHKTFYFMPFEGITGDFTRPNLRAILGSLKVHEKNGRSTGSDGDQTGG